jgi:hypothetical protein
VAIRPADVARIKKDQEGLFWYRVDIERTDHFDFSYFQVMFQPGEFPDSRKSGRIWLMELQQCQHVRHMSCFLCACT